MDNYNEIITKVNSIFERIAYEAQQAIIYLCANADEVDARKRSDFNIIQFPTFAPATMPNETQKSGQNIKILRPKETQEKLIIKIKDGICRKRGNSYEYRYRRNGYEVSFTSTIKHRALKMFSAWALQENARLASAYSTLGTPGTAPQPKKEVHTFQKMIELALELKKPLIKAVTFANYEYILNKYARQFFERDISEISPAELQRIVNALYSEGKTRTILDIKVIVGYIFETAIKNGYINRNPVEMVTFPHHYRKNGEALTIDEERAFVKAIRGEELEGAFLFMLYTGCRRAEVIKMKTEYFDLKKNTVMIPCAKLKGQKDFVLREVPIFPKLKEWLTRFSPECLNVNPDNLTLYFHRRYCKEHHLHELRHTFISRAKECEINNELVATWAGHSIEGIKRGKITATVYTHFSAEYQQREAKKLRY